MCPQVTFDAAARRGECGLDGTANFALVAFQVTGPDAGDLTITKNGIDKNGRETATCSLLSPKDGVTRFLVTGFFTPAG